MTRKTKEPGSYGALFAVEERMNPKQPVLSGTLTLQPSMLQYITEAMESNETVKLNISGWINFCSENGREYLTLKVQAPYPPRKRQRLEKNDGADIFRHLTEMD
jgi:hypothetical protein